MLAAEVKITAVLKKTQLTKVIQKAYMHLFKALRP